MSLVNTTHILGFSIPNLSASPPKITSISPNSGLPKGGYNVTITGKNLSKITEVIFGTSTVKIDSKKRTNTRIICKVPKNKVGIVYLTLISKTKTKTKTKFTYVNPTPPYLIPTITNINPSSGVISGGTSITITGTNFKDIKKIYFDTIDALNFIVNSDTVITAISPPKRNNIEGDVDLSIITGGDSATSLFKYVMPTITDISPKSGPINGGTVITITGTNLINISIIKFGTTDVTIRAIPIPTDKKFEIKSPQYSNMEGGVVELYTTINKTPFLIGSFKYE
jgi:hypothetical protein